MRPVSLLVEAPPPTRQDPVRCADRWSPNALPLFRAAARFVADNPEDFPIRQNVGMVVTSPNPLPAGDGYGAIEPIIEVLVDAGLLADERLVTWERSEVAPDMKGYSVVVDTDRS